MSLQNREKRILRAVIVEYIRGAEPVPSELLVHRYDLGVRSATVRNELAALTEGGYLEQPHTSAGRKPSDLGYRYFVDNLIEVEELSDARRRAVSPRGDGELLQSLVLETTAALSRLTHLLSAATIMRGGQTSVRSAILSALGPHKALLVLVLSNGHAESRVLECPSGLTLEEVGKANELIAASVAGKGLRALKGSKPPATPPESSLESLLVAVWGILRSVCQEHTRGALVTEGEEFLFGQPEFMQRADALAQILETLKSSGLLYEALGSPDQTGTVTIGKEHRAEEMHSLSVVKRSFYVGQSEAGTIGLVGPTRLDYESSIPLVDFTAKALTDALTRFAG